MREVILQKMEDLEKANGVEILFACESGSRAWGFASEDSDFDVRFIYRHPLNSYLSIADFRDVIELPVNEVLDISGWDLRKGLKLLKKSNAVVFEWLQSPIIYRSNAAFHKDMLRLMPAYFSKRAVMHHYLSMAANTFSELQGEEIKLKKYFYVLRPLLAAMWVIEKGGIPPMEFCELRKLVSDATWHTEVDKLLEIKKQVNEKHLIKPVPELHEFIKNNLPKAEAAAAEFGKMEGDAAELDIFFRKWIA